LAVAKVSGNLNFLSKNKIFDHLAESLPWNCRWAIGA
jgi:hypothetical protein